ncbi:MAG: GNAT family N-acetyltransferase [Eubacteriales bacterium]|nr:GNAT family N-acetyltransferase [Eubacteriales bacterium]
MDIIYIPSLSSYNKELEALYLSEGLETDGTKDAFYSVEAKDGGTLVGGITLSRRYGVTVLDYVAVLPEYRKHGIGRTLVDTAFKTAKDKNIREIFLVTKAEGFFAKLGAVRTDEHNELLSECFSCSRYMEKCRPVLMKIRI